VLARQITWWGIHGEGYMSVAVGNSRVGPIHRWSSSMCEGAGVVVLPRSPSVLSSCWAVLPWPADHKLHLSRAWRGQAVQPGGPMTQPRACSRGLKAILEEGV
jgi:hypothetical protein